MTEGESEENHMLSRGKKKGGRDSAESVAQAHGRLFESTY